MIDVFQARLEARDPAKGHFRAYALAAGIDLLGAWTVDILYGRIGGAGRRIRHVAASADDARRLVSNTLRRRSTAKKRIGTSYRLLELHDPEGWYPINVG